MAVYSKRLRSGSFDYSSQEPMSSITQSTITSRSTRAAGSLGRRTRNSMAIRFGKRGRRGFNFGIYRSLALRTHCFESTNNFYVQVNVGSTGAFGLSTFAQGAYSGTPTGPGVGASINANALQFAFCLNQVNVYGGSNGTAAIASYTFPDVQSYANLFEEYRIDAVTVSMYWNINSLAIPVGDQRYALPMCYFAKDYDDAVPVSLQTLQSYSSCKAIQFGNSSGETGGRQSISLVPKCSLMAFNSGGGSVAGSNRTHCWLDMDNQQIEHHGLKMCFDNFTTGSAYDLGYINMVFKIKFSCRTTR